MKAGFENSRKVAFMIALLVVAAYMLVRGFYSPGAPTATATTTADPAARTKQAPTARRSGRQPIVMNEPGVDPLNPTLRFDWLKNSEDREYAGGKRNIFGLEPEPEPQKPREVAKGPTCPGDPGCPPPPPVCPGPDPRCPPPPINLKFYGFASRPGEPKRVFLASGEDTFVATEGEIVNRRYRVVKINPTSVEIEDVLNNNKQTIPLSQG
jgi:hypothetical protein